MRCAARRAPAELALEDVRRERELRCVREPELTDGGGRCTSARRGTERVRDGGGGGDRRRDAEVELAPLQQAQVPQHNAAESAVVRAGEQSVGVAERSVDVELPPNEIQERDLVVRNERCLSVGDRYAGEVARADKLCEVARADTLLQLERASRELAEYERERAVRVLDLAREEQRCDEQQIEVCALVRGIAEVVMHEDKGVRNSRRNRKAEAAPGKGNESPADLACFLGPEGARRL